MAQRVNSSSSISSPLLPVSGEKSSLPYDALTISEFMHQVVVEKRKNFEETEKNRFKGIHLVEELTYLTSDGSTVGFSAFQGVALLTKATAGMILTGGICGIVGGVLSALQGFFILIQAGKAFANDQGKLGGINAVQGLCLLAVGVIMTLVSLAAVTTLLAGIMGVIAVIGNPYVMPIFLLILAGLTYREVDRLLSSTKEICSHFLENLNVKEKILSYLQNFVTLESVKKKLGKEVGEERLGLEWMIATMERFSQELGVEAGMEMMDLLHLALKEEEAEEHLIECKEKIEKWKRDQRFRKFQLALYCLTAPLGGAAVAPIAAKAAKVISAASKFFFTLPSAIACYFLYAKPYSGNVQRSVKKVKAENIQLLPFQSN